MRLLYLPFADTGTDLDDSTGWLEVEVGSDAEAFEFCEDHDGLIECAELGVDRARIVIDGRIDYNA